MTPNQIEKHIWLYENVLTKKECEAFIDKYEQTLAFKKGHALFREKVEEMEIPTYDPSDVDYDDITYQLWSDVDEFIYKFSEKVLHLYFENYMLATYEYEYCGCKMLYYPPFSYSPTHYDDELVASDGSPVGVARPITLVVFLNEDFEAGDLIFPDQNVAIKPKQGAIAVFPASYMYPHTTTPTCGRARYVLLPFYRKAGLNAKIAHHNKTVEGNKAMLRDYRKLFSSLD